jgi:hypothetical protein
MFFVLTAVVLSQVAWTQSFIHVCILLNAYLRMMPGASQTQDHLYNVQAGLSAPEDVQKGRSMLFARAKQSNIVMGAQVQLPTKLELHGLLLAYVVQGFEDTIFLR